MSPWDASNAPVQTYALAIPVLITPFLMVPLLCSKHVEKSGAGVQKYLVSMFAVCAPFAIAACLIGAFAKFKDNGVNAALWSVLLPFALGTCACPT